MDLNEIDPASIVPTYTSAQLVLFAAAEDNPGFKRTLAAFMRTGGDALDLIATQSRELSMLYELYVEAWQEKLRTGMLDLDLELTARLVIEEHEGEDG